MALTRIERIDTLFASAAAEPLHSENAEGHADAVGIIQELLACQGYPGMPNIKQIGVYGKFGPLTRKHLKDFRLKHVLQTNPAEEPQVDFWTLRRLAQEFAVSPRASRGYLALALDIELTGVIKILSFIALAEARGGRFGEINANTDLKGLSYGIIQWAQKPKRLHDIVSAFQTRQPFLFRSIFGATADAMVAHTNRPNGGIDPATGVSTDPTNFNLIDAVWQERFKNAGLPPALQKVQVETARQAFVGLIDSIRSYASATIKSERGFAFMIDLGNQHGGPGAKSVYQAVVTPGMSDENEALAKIADESHRRLKVQYGDDSPEARSTRTRRDFFRSTTLLSTAPFNDN